jgi:hypothetical protein
MLSVGYSCLLLLLLFTSCAFVTYGYLYLRDDYEIDTNDFMNQMMGTIFIVFGTLKLVNLKTFSTIFSKYDLLSQRIPMYGYLYPFLEILLGLSFIHPVRNPPWLVGPDGSTLQISYVITLVLMGLSLIGVSMSMVQGTPLRCGCLGSFFHIPLSYVTISENIVMIAMTLFLLKTYRVI